MTPQKAIENEPTKREAWLALSEKTRVRIPVDIHFRLTQFCQSRRYSKTFDALLYCASVGLSVLQTAENVNVISVDNRDKP